MSPKLIFSIAITLFGWICAGCTVHFFWQFFRNPTNFNKGFGLRILSYAYFTFVWVGIGYCIFRGAEATLQWMPRSWVTFSDEGEPIWKGDELAGIAAILGSALLMEEMSKLAEKLQDAERDRGR
ncbi:MAG: hypothetical protein ACREDT_01670 [Methylocella sp.]